MEADVSNLPGSEARASAATTGSGLRRLAVGLALLLCLALLARALGGRIPAFVAWVDGLGPLAPLVFAAAYAVGVVCFVPGSALTLAAGALFGIGEGLLVAWCAATIGSAMAFLVARYVARGAVEERIAGSPRFAAIDQAVGKEGLKIVLLLRLSPVFPFTLLNYGLGLTRVRFLDYIVASVGMIPGTLLYVYYGQVIGLAAQLAGGAKLERGPADWAIFGLGLLATLGVTILVTRIARRALAQATGE